MKKKPLVFQIMVFLILPLMSCGSPSMPEPTPTPEVHVGEAIVASRCVGCHGLNRVTNASYDRQGWKLTVDRMVLSGAELSDEQVEQVVDYLTLTYSEE